MKKKVIALSLFAMMLTTAGCSTATPSSSSSPQATTAQNQPTDTNKKISNKLDFNTLFPNADEKSYAQKFIGTQAPDFTLKSLDGQGVQLSKLKGQNVVLEFALTNCPACIETFPQVEVFKASRPDVKVFTIFPNETKQQAELFFKQNHYKRDGQILAGEGMTTVAMNYNITFTPTFLFVDKEGYIQFIHVGSADSQVLSSMADLAFHTNGNSPATIKK
ncbi:TlpA disulfide reductase family protein (plasmid) [Aneurinibacillus sp. Ricciae_BoGa-3]|uniref:TlpA family protein disulfide reductase n=1 Tax=Aneurinibacillus sp. Ricciae_BoGa-3 TaxID=3022697 RepID=UPI002340C99B|nr:TlpA disulfide reductase family protein [Aneurinibacillus sp. Ricciae_BoGa-3]WCK56935.1 TlpA disulfide reductase family protein [Aneurinibacillus sp. Ricciae_BoGa-3]WCK57758.1 TlpA disulfide reductase family protein [Aneurinibacillus sp. Ricciae_BoGa-3]